MPLLTSAEWSTLRSMRARSVSEWAALLRTSPSALEGLSKGGEAVEVGPLPPEAVQALEWANAGRCRREGRASITKALDGSLAEVAQSSDPAAILLELVVRLARVIGGARVVARLLDEGIVPGGAEGRDAIAAFRRKA